MDTERPGALDPIAIQYNECTRFHNKINLMGEAPGTKDAMKSHFIQLRENARAPS